MANLLDRWKSGLSKTSKAAFGQIANLLGATELTPELWEDLEALLIQADVGLDTTEEILIDLESKADERGYTRASHLKEALREELLSQIQSPPVLTFDQGPSVILIVGVNGSGKTTSIAKLAKNFSDKGNKVLLGAADTYRAAAVDQLEIWAGRLDIPVISGQVNADAGAVAFDAVASAKSKKMDIVLIDTAGRLHTRYNLMEELKKVYRVIGKSMDGAPHHVWLVMDATTGQNALNQAKAFKDSVKISGVILAKLDSSARGGMVFAIQNELKLPILYVGIGEKAEDLQPFNPTLFVEGILN